MCGGLPSIKPVVCKVILAEAEVIWRVMIWALAQAGNRAGKTRHHCAVMRSGAQARSQTCSQLSPHHSTSFAPPRSASPFSLSPRSRVMGPVGLRPRGSYGRTAGRQREIAGELRGGHGASRGDYEGTTGRLRGDFGESAGRPLAKYSRPTQSRSFRKAAETPTVGLEPMMTRLRALRSTD